MCLGVKQVQAVRRIAQSITKQTSQVQDMRDDVIEARDEVGMLHTQAKMQVQARLCCSPAPGLGAGWAAVGVEVALPLEVLLGLAGFAAEFLALDPHS